MGLDTPIEERSEDVPMMSDEFVACRLCGALIFDLKRFRDTHDNWHLRLQNDLDDLES